MDEPIQEKEGDPWLVPPEFDADVANSIYGDRYGIDWEYIG